MEEIQSSHECPIPELSHITQGYGTRDRWEQNKTGEFECASSHLVYARTLRD